MPQRIHQLSCKAAVGLQQPGPFRRVLPRRCGLLQPHRGTASRAQYAYSNRAGKGDSPSRQDRSKERRRVVINRCLFSSKRSRIGPSGNNPICEADSKGGQAKMMARRFVPAEYVEVNVASGYAVVCYDWNRQFLFTNRKHGNCLSQSESATIIGLLVHRRCIRCGGFKGGEARVVWRGGRVVHRRRERGPIKGPREASAACGQLVGPEGRRCTVWGGRARFEIGTGREAPPVLEAWREARWGGVMEPGGPVREWYARDGANRALPWRVTAGKSGGARGWN